MLAELLSLAEIRDIIVSERMKVYEASFNFDLNNAPDYSYFFNIINFIPKRDNIKITLQDENERIFEVSSSKTEGEEEYKTFLKNTLDDETINVKLRIDKKVEENHFSIYSYDEFVKDILMLSIEQVMIAFSGLLSQVSTFLVFDVYSPMTMFATKTMLYHIGARLQIQNSIENREWRVAKKFHIFIILTLMKYYQMILK